LIQVTPARALETLMRLTSLLRGVLRSEGEFTTLGREIDLVEAYLDIERARFEHRLKVCIEVPEDLRDLSVPPLILQPLVENAVKHGIAPLRHGGEIAVTAVRSGEPSRLIVRVADTGPGLSAGEVLQRRRNGVGLNNVERRLQCYYGAAASITFQSCPGRGTFVELALPAATPAAVPVRRLS
jgi:sensor histidine kinase YesM